MTDNVHPLRAAQRTTQAHVALFADADTILADIALDNPDLEPAGMHTAITLWRNRYRTWLASHYRHPSAGPRDAL